MSPFSKSSLTIFTSEELLLNVFVSVETRENYTFRIAVRALPFRWLRNLTFILSSIGIYRYTSIRVYIGASFYPYSEFLTVFGQATMRTKQIPSDHTTKTRNTLNAVYRMHTPSESSFRMQHTHSLSNFGSKLLYLPASCRHHYHNGDFLTFLKYSEATAARTADISNASATRRSMKSESLLSRRQNRRTSHLGFGSVTIPEQKPRSFLLHIHETAVQPEHCSYVNGFSDIISSPLAEWYRNQMQAKATTQHT